MPELLEGFNVGQNKHHIYDVWEHNIRALRYAVEQDYSTEVRLASLLHDVGKPRSKRGEGEDSTFYAHEMIGAKMTRELLKRLKFPKDSADKIVKLVRWHLFYYNVGEVTESSVRRLVANIGKENVEDLIKVREADRIGSGVPKAKPYKLRHLQFMIDKVARDPISPKMLKIDGNEVMAVLGIKPGPQVGLIISALMNEVLDDPGKNDKEYLEKRAAELSVLPEPELSDLARAGKEKTSEKEEEMIGQIKRKHKV
jgi:poly(A) polymerase/tRNA nucleotidyltransferase (CCA-adding enzyme)